MILLSKADRHLSVQWFIPHQSGYIPCTGVFVSSHLLCRVDVDALVELILKHRHHGVVPGDSVDPGVLQTHVLHQAAADLHDQRDELRRTQTELHHQ